MFISFLHAKLIKGKATTSILVYKIPKPLTILKYNPVYFFILTVLGLLLSGLFSSCGEQGYSSCLELLVTLVAQSYSSCSMQWLLLLRSMGSRVQGPQQSKLPGPRAQTQLVVAHSLNCSAACGIFLDQGQNLCLLNWQADSSPLSHQGSP